MHKLLTKRILLPLGLLLLFIVVIRKCSFHSLPNEKLQLFAFDKEENYNDQGYQLSISNPIHCPIRLFLSSKESELDSILTQNSPIVLEAKRDSTILISDKGDLSGKIDVKLKLGDPSLPITSKSVASLPYPSGKRYELLQGINANPTHNHDFSRYAFDFTMSTGDTLCSVHDGYVIGLIDGYTGWGHSSKWKPYSNQIIIYDTTTHLFSLYGHLKQNGSLVALGDYVKSGQPIALSGKTGFTTEEHLHFNMLKANNHKSGMTSYRLDSIGPYKVSELKRYQSMQSK